MLDADNFANLQSLLCHGTCTTGFFDGLSWAQLRQLVNSLPYREQSFPWRSYLLMTDVANNWATQPRATLPSLETQSGAFADAAEFIHLDSHNRAVLMGLVLNQDGPGYIYAVPGDNVPEFVHIRPTVQRQERDWPTVCAIPYEHIFDLVKSQWSPQPGQEQDQIHQPQRLWRYQGAVDWLKSWEMPDGNWIKTSWRILKRESGISLWIYHFFISANTLMKLPKIRLFLCNQNAGFAVAPSTPEYPADNAFLM